MLKTIMTMIPGDEPLRSAVDTYRWVSQMHLTSIDVSTFEDAADGVPTAREELEPDDRPPHFEATLFDLFGALLVRLPPLRDRY